MKKPGQEYCEHVRPDLLGLRIAVDDIARALLGLGNGPEEIAEFLRAEAERVAGEMLDGSW